MSSPFLFLPRAVSKTKKDAPKLPPQKTSLERKEPAEGNDPDGGAPNDLTNIWKETSSKIDSGLSNEEYCVLIHLALSDYALWSDPDLRQLIATSSSPSDDEPAFIPLRKLLRQSTVLAPFNLVPHETSISKAIRADSDIKIEIRLLVSHSTSHDVGAYEIRRRDWETAITAIYTKAYWEERTIYAEHIPSQFKNVPNLAKFISSLSHSGSRCRIQGVLFPSHHRDKPGDRPSYKGFALFVLEALEDVNYILRCWPWSPTRSAIDDDELATAGSGSTNKKEAISYSFRTLSKLRWGQLREEYQAFNRRLIEEINTWNDTQKLHAPHKHTVPETSVSRPTPEQVVSNPPPALNQFSKFPPNSLVFVRNLHPETNKTTLRKLFSNAPSGAQIHSDGIDYVDYTKGMDSCHLRFATPQHARTFADYFSLNALLQKSGLDEVGIPAKKSTSASAISVELVTGRREELYWEKVPEKVRLQAVQKVLQNTEGSTSGGDSTGNNNSSTKRRKR